VSGYEGDRYRDEIRPPLHEFDVQEGTPEQKAGAMSVRVVPYKAEKAATAEG